MFELNEHQSWDGRVGLRRQIKVLVRKGVGSNPTLNTIFFSYFIGPTKLLKILSYLLQPPPSNKLGTIRTKTDSNVDYNHALLIISTPNHIIIITIIIISIIIITIKHASTSTSLNSQPELLPLLLLVSTSTLLILPLPRLLTIPFFIWVYIKNTQGYLYTMMGNTKVF